VHDQFGPVAMKRFLMKAIFQIKPDSGVSAFMKAQTAASPSTPLLTTSEAMAFLKVSRNALCKWVRDGRIPAVTLPNGAYRFDPDQFLNRLPGLPVTTK
jgi:excisionase family DNA binding protein